MIKATTAAAHHLTPKSIALSGWGLEWFEGTAVKWA